MSVMFYYTREEYNKCAFWKAPESNIHIICLHLVSIEYGKIYAIIRQVYRGNFSLEVARSSTNQPSVTPEQLA